nr:hypothetical protein A3J29_07225 [uncultured bacterium]
MALRERLFALEQFGIKLGLDNITRLLDARGRPDRAWKSVHIAGTNGKGSVTAMVERGLRAAGHRTGRYTSPHLSHIEERIAIDGVPIDAATFDAATADVLATVDALRADGTLEVTPTFFEVTTAVAFEIFRRANVGVGVIEVGLGGRFDATNVITPSVTAITSIALDHERHLGTTLAQIAFEKAGVIKRGVPVVVGAVPGEAMTVIRDVAATQGAPLVHAGPEQVASMTLRNGRGTVTIETPEHRYPSVDLALAGAHQVGNATVAVRTLEVCRARGIQNEASDVLTALTDVAWPARIEFVRMDDNKEVILDAAHNPDGAAALAEFLRSAGLAPLPLVVAVMKDKDVQGMVRALVPVASLVVATQADSARALPAAELKAVVQSVSSVAVDTFVDPYAAVMRALDGVPRAVVAGSIFLVGPLRERLLPRP